MDCFNASESPMMKYIQWRTLFIVCGYLSLSHLLSSCQDELMEKVVVFSDDFSSMDATHLTNGKWHEFNGDTVLGWYHNEEVTLNIPKLPSHNTLEITIELLIHDSWDGNPDNIGGPDYWLMHLDGEEIINATFSNTPCGFNFCLYQSFPENYPRTFEPKTGAIDTALPGRCQYNGVQGWTSKYRITRLIKHDSPSLSISLKDQLLQLNAADPKCDESWSVSKIEISTLTVK